MWHVRHVCQMRKAQLLCFFCVFFLVPTAKQVWISEGENAIKPFIIFLVKVLTDWQKWCIKKSFFFFFSPIGFKSNMQKILILIFAMLFSKKKCHCFTNYYTSIKPNQFREKQKISLQKYQQDFYDHSNTLSGTN